MSIRLIAFDLDGTLLRQDKTISGRTEETLYKAAEKGILLVPATGRNYNGIPEQVGRLPFIRYVIGINGAQIFDRESQKVLRRVEMGREACERMLDYMEQVPAVTTCYQDGRGWVEAKDWELLEKHAPYPEQIAHMKRTFVPLENMRKSVFAYGSTLQKLQMFFQNGVERDRYFAEMNEKFPDYAISYSLPNNIEINAIDATKGAALKFLCEYLHLDCRESMAFGDGINDVSMIRQAGTGVAMENAEKEVLEIADRVTASNNEDGVAVMIEKVLQNC